MTDYRLGWCAAAETESPDPASLRAVLAPSELAELEGLAPKRRRDRLAGRLAAKRALVEHLRDEEGWDADPRDLVLSNDAQGRPVLTLPPDASAAIPSFSLSHADWGGVCAVAAPGRRVGCDLEAVKARPRKVLEFVASRDELAAQERLSRPEGQARLWTGKEAVLKLLGLGLAADARMVEVSPDGATVRLGGEPEARWRALGRPRLAVDFVPREGSLVAVARTQ